LDEPEVRLNEGATPLTWLIVLHFYLGLAAGVMFVGIVELAVSIH
jgi:hypothetical protein